MKRFRSYWSNFKELIRDLNYIDVLVLLLTVTGINLTVIIQTYTSQSKTYILIGILISIVLILFIVSFFGGKRGTRFYHIFEEDSTEEAEFFNQWYRKPGKLILFCTDLKWLANEKYLKVRDALEKKGADLDIYIKDPEGSLVKSLQTFHAKLHVVRQDIRSVHKFSILQNDGFQSIIIRNKEAESDKIEIEEYNKNPALVNVSLDMLDDCELINKKRRAKKTVGKHK